MEPARPARAAVDEASVGLDQRGAGADALPRVVGGRDAAGGDQRDAAAEPGPQPAQHGERARRERGTRQPAGPERSDRGVGRRQPGARDRGVGGDDAVEPELEREIGDRVDVGVGQVRRDLDQQRHAAGRRREVARGAHGGQERAELVDRLEVAEAGRVRRADVDHEVVGVRGEPPGAVGEVGDRLGLGDAPGLADVGADRAGAAMCEPARRGRGAVVVEAHAVDQRAIAGQPEHPGPRVAGLRLGGDRADLDEAEAEREQRAHAPGVLVEPGGEPERAGQLAAERVDAELGGTRGAQPLERARDAGQHDRGPQQRERHAVGRLRREPPQHEPVQQAIHPLPYYRAWPTSPSTRLPGLEPALELGVARAARAAAVARAARAARSGLTLSSTTGPSWRTCGARGAHLSDRPSRRAARAPSVEPPGGLCAGVTTASGTVSRPWSCRRPPWTTPGVPPANHAAMLQKPSDHAAHRPRRSADRGGVKDLEAR